MPCMARVASGVQRPPWAAVIARRTSSQVCSESTRTPSRSKITARVVMVSSNPGAPTRSGHGGAHDAVILSFGAVVGESGLLECAAGRVVQERRRHLLARGVLGIALDGPAAGLRDELERSVQRGARDA